MHDFVSHNSATSPHLFHHHLIHQQKHTMSPITAPAHRPSKLQFITGNANKLAEVRAILADTGVELSSKALDLPELQGGIEEISRDKCRRAAEAVSCA